MNHRRAMLPPAAMPSALDLRARTHPLVQAPTPANRGAQRRINPCDTTPQSILSNQIDPSVWGEPIGIVFGVSFGDLPGDEFVPFWAGLRARIEWGIGTTGAFHAEVDLLHGTILSIPAENVRGISAYFEAKARKGVTADVAALPCADVSVGTAYGYVGKNSNPARLTKPVFLDAPSDVVRLKVPPFAISMTVQSDSDDPLDLLFANLGNTVTRFKGIVPTSTTLHSAVENAMPIPNGAQYVDVSSPSLQGPSTVLVIFGLSL